MQFKLGNIGCLILILVLILAVSMVSFVFTIVFKTPVGLILLGYIVYRLYFKKSKVTQETTTHFHENENENNHDNFDEAQDANFEEVNDVNYEDND